MFNTLEITERIEQQLRPLLKEHIENHVDDHDLVMMHNTYCQNSNDPDNEIFENSDDFFETFFDGRVTEAIRAAFYGTYDYPDDWVKFNGYANLESSNDPMDWIDTSALVDDILECPENYPEVERWLEDEVDTIREEIEAEEEEEEEDEE